MIYFYTLLSSLRRSGLQALCLLVLLAPGGLKAQDAERSLYEEGALYDRIINPNIRTVLFSRQGLPGSYPILELNSADKLELSFDELDTKTRTNYQFTIVHCDADWRPSNIFQSEYINGIFQDYISTFNFSRNTYAKYVHYNLEFPSYNMQPKISGNYLLKIFIDDPEQPVLQRRFYVYENLVEVGAQVKRASYAKYRDNMQEIDFTVNSSNLNILDPFQNIKVVLKQNWRWDNEIRNLKPLYVNGSSLTYNYEEGNLFNAGNEFRMFDIRDFRFKGLGVKYFIFDSIYQAKLFTDEDRSYNAYNTYVDQDGNYTIASRLGIDASTDADYALVNFQLRPSYRADGQSVYVFGALSNWQLDDRFKMKYNVRDGYELSALVKQGFYDYQYVIVNEHGQVDPSLYEGDHWETENNYTIFVYYRHPSMATDQLVGIARLNSVLK